MERWLLLLLAEATLGAHLAFIVWVMFGALLTRRRPWLGAAHVASLAYGIFIELGPWPCPLTFAENWFEARAGFEPYRGPFLLHYLDAIVYPHLSATLLAWAGVAVCLLNLGVYLRRWLRRS